MTMHDITDAEYATALAAGLEERGTEMRAQSVRYVSDRDAVEIITKNGAGFLIPRAWIGALRDVPVAELDRLEIWPDGSAIELENRDIHISVHGLLAATLPGMVSVNALNAIFASRGGKVTSDAKRNTARANGRKGGRPRKAATP